MYIYCTYMCGLYGFKSGVNLCGRIFLSVNLTSQRSPYIHTDVFTKPFYMTTIRHNDLSQPLSVLTCFIAVILCNTAFFCDTIKVEISINPLLCCLDKSHTVGIIIPVSHHLTVSGGLCFFVTLTVCPPVSQTLSQNAHTQIHRCKHT